MHQLRKLRQIFLFSEGIYLSNLCKMMNMEQLKNQVIKMAFHSSKQKLRKGFCPLPLYTPLYIHQNSVLDIQTVVKRKMLS